MKRVLRVIHGLSQRCGALPFAGLLVLVAVARVGALVAPAKPVANLPPAIQEALPEDFALIDQVLAKRAPDLGLTLRRQVGVAIAEEAKKAGYDPLLVLAIIDVESDFNEDALSNKGAKGLMQIKPSTLYFLAQREGIRLSREEVQSDPALCVRLGIRYLRWLNDRFGGNLDYALMAYNAGPAKIRAAIREGELDTFRRYPNLVRRDFRKFREGVGLGGDWALAVREVPMAQLPSLSLPDDVP